MKSTHEDENWIYNESDERFLILKKQLIARRNSIEYETSNSKYNTQEFANIESNLIKNGFLKDSLFKKVRIYLINRIKPFTLGLVIAGSIMPQLMIENTITRSGPNLEKEQKQKIIEKDSQIINELIIQSTDPKSLGNIITNQALDLQLETTSKLINNEIILIISGFKNESIELQFKNDLGIADNNFQAVRIRILLKK
jgi:hypothetical protein